MCVLLLAYHVHPDYDLIVAANRDEFYDRPTAAAQFWDDAPGILAGRDLSAGGTWLGVNAGSQFAAVTNLRGAAGPSRHSRGHLVRDFLQHGTPSADYLTNLAPRAADYSGCNLLVEDTRTLHWWSHAGTRALEPGVYGMSNTPLDYEWPKVGRLKTAFAPLTVLHTTSLETALFDILRDREQSARDPGDSLLGSLRLEDMIFVQANGYGTRCSTVVLRRRDGHIEFVERSFDDSGKAVGDQRFSIVPG